MLCWSCGKEIAENAVRCQYCEADVVQSPDLGELEVAREFLENMDPELQSELLRVFQSSKTGEEFVNRIMVGECPKCGSSKTGDCEHDPDIEDISIGRCFECGHLWCTMCDCDYVPGADVCPQCAELDGDFEDDFDEEFDEEMYDQDPRLDRYHLMAAEIFGYSFANYRDHVGIGKIRYDKLMPEAARLLEQAVEENWPVERVAEQLFPGETIEQSEAEKFLQACREAIEVIDADDPSEAFRRAVRHCVRDAADRGLQDEKSIEHLVTQICYRAADLAVLLEMDGHSLSHYSQQLRHEPDDYFDEEDYEE